MSVEEDVGGSGRVSLDLLGQVGFVMCWGTVDVQDGLFLLQMFEDLCGFSFLQMFNVPSNLWVNVKLTKNILQADELVDMVWIWIDAQEISRKETRCKIGQVQKLQPDYETFLYS